MRRKVLWVMSVLVLCALAGCSPVQGTGMEDAPYQLTIAQLKANPEQYDMQWVEFDAYLYCMQAEEGRMATLLQEHAEEDTANRDKIKISVIEGYEGYEGMKKLVEEELGIKVLGYVPRVEDCVIESRHLGLILPEEIPELKGRLLKLAEVLENSLEIEEILKGEKRSGCID